MFIKFQRIFTEDCIKLVESNREREGERNKKKSNKTKQNNLLDAFS